MRSLLFSLFFFFSFSIFASTQDLLVQIDDRWHLDYQNSNGTSSIQEMTIEGENVNNWSELLTIQKQPRFNFPLSDYYKLLIESLQNNIHDAVVRHRLIDLNN